MFTNPTREKSGIFITFEGIDLSGKSTQMGLTSEWLSTRGFGHCCTREPGGTSIGTKIREALLCEETSVVALPLCEMFLCFADRVQHIAEVIKPNLEKGRIVLCDRYHDSTKAYQGYGHGVSSDLIDRIWSADGYALDPDHTFLLDIDPQTAISRLA